MEISRQIYWNIGHGVVLPMYILVFAAFGCMAWGFRQRLSIWRQGKALDRFDRYDERIKRMLAEVFSQAKIYRVTDGGVFHSIFFWSFLILSAGTMLVMFQADFFTPLLQVNLLSGEFYKAFSLALDLAGILALLMLAGLFIRRFVIKPKGLEIVRDDYIVLQLLFAILITGFLIEGARMAATELRQNPELVLFSPGGLLFGQLFTTLTTGTLLVTHKILWWLHFALVLGFFCAIPYTKLRHIFTTGANAFLAPLEAKGNIATINLEDESIEQFGAASIGDLTWKDIFDADACTSCKRCQGALPGIRNRQAALAHEDRQADRRTGQETGQRIPLPDDRHRKHRTDQGLQHQENSHHLPALLQHPGPRLQGSGARHPGGTYSTYINTLLNSGSLRLTAEPFSFTYHDSCYLGRYMDIIEQPRSILEQAGGSITEMDKSGYDSFCCSAGGGRIIAEEKLGSKISEVRIKMATDTGAPTLVSNCPFCLTMFENGIKTGGAEGRLQVRDLAEIVADRIAT